MTRDDELRALHTVALEALRWANWCAGQGICAIESEGVRAPEDFLMDYSDATGDEDWETAPERIAERIRALASQPQKEDGREDA